MLYDTSINNRDKWIKEIQKYTGDKDTAHTIQYALSFTLQALRNGDADRYKWKDCGGDKWMRKYLQPNMKNGYKKKPKNFGIS